MKYTTTIVVIGYTGSISRCARLNANHEIAMPTTIAATPNSALGSAPMRGRTMMRKVLATSANRISAHFPQSGRDR